GDGVCRRAVLVGPQVAGRRAEARDEDCGAACGIGFRMFWRIPSILMALALLGATPLHAVQVDEILPDPGLETRARALSHERRCMVCQHQSIDDSEAPL